MNKVEKKEALIYIYSRLKDNLLKDNLLFGTSCFISLLKLSSNKRHHYIRISSVPQNKLDINVTTLLLRDNYLEKIESGYSDDLLVLTAKAIWDIDKYENDLNESDLIAYFEKKDFKVINFSAKLSSKERRVLLLLIVMRCFDNETCLDLNDYSKLTVWDDLFEKVNSLLVKYRINKANDKIKKYTRHSSLDEEIIRVNDLTKKTDHLFKFVGSKKYIIDVKEKEEISIKRLNFLFKLLLSNSTLTVEEVLEFSDTINTLNLEYSTKLKESSVYTNIETDELIFESIKRVIIS